MFYRFASISRVVEDVCAWVDAKMFLFRKYPNGKLMKRNERRVIILMLHETHTEI